jgi:DNA (cytosine-5)-methyltransferase 3A
MGDVCALRGENLPPIDLLMGGSPCQGFSFAGKQLNFKDPRSALFFQFVRLLRETKPKYFLLENVRMKQEYQDVISEHLGVEPVKINSALVAAQNRVRLYWTNIPGIEQPEDKGIVLKDILEDLPIDKPLAPYMTGEFDGVSRLDKGIFTFTDKDKSAAQTGSGGHANKYLIHRPLVLDGPYPMQFKAKNKKNVIINESDLDAPRTVYEARTELGKQTRREIKKLTGKDSTKRSPEHKQYQVQKHQKANCLVTVDSELNKVIDKELVYRKLTPMECMRLQTVPDHYFDDTGISNTQKYKLLGNGWTVDIICHVLKNIRAEFARKVA